MSPLAGVPAAVAFAVRLMLPIDSFVDSKAFTFVIRASYGHGPRIIE